MPRSSAKIGLLFITSAFSVMGFDAYREHRSAQRNDFRYDSYFPGTTQPSGYYHNGTHYHYSHGYGFMSDDYHSSSSSSSSSGSRSSSMSHTSRGGFGSTGHSAGS